MKIMQMMLLLAAVMICGCRVIEPVETPRGHFFLNPQENLAAVNRVVLLELENYTTSQDIAASMTQSLAEGLGKKHLFSVRTVYRTDMLWRQLDIDNINAYSYDDLAAVEQNFKADAVLFGHVKRYAGFPHMMVGLHLKMVNLRTGRLIWALEEVWDSTDRNVEMRMKRYFSKHMRRGYEPIEWELLTTSPLAFNKYVVHEITATLPDLADKEVTAGPIVSESRPESFIQTGRIRTP